MADILISKFTTQIPRVGATPATPGFAESEGQDPVVPSGTPIQYGIGAGLSLDSLNQIQLGKTEPSYQLIDLKDFDISGVSSLIIGYDDSVFYEDFIYADKINDDLQKSLTLTSIAGYKVNEAYFANGFNAEYILNVRNGSSLNSYNLRLYTEGISSIASFEDNINQKGLEYTADYESNFTARSLVTKQYVDGAISGAGHNPVTIGSPANGLSIDASQVLTIGLASTSATGALSSTDWNTFNNKLNLTSPITGYTVGANTALVATDTILQAFGKVQGQINARISGTIASGQVAFGTGANTIGGDSGLTWDNSLKKLSINSGLFSHSYTETSTASPRPIIQELRYYANPNTSPISSIDFHGIDLFHYTQGSNINSLTRIYAFESAAVHTTSATVGKIVPVFSAVTNNSTGTINEASNIRIFTQNNSTGIISNLKSIEIDAPTNSSGTITNFYGVHIENPTTASNSWGIFDLSPKSYFLRIGISNTNPSASLQISESNSTHLRIDGNISGAVTSFGILNTPTIQSNVTTSFRTFQSAPTLQATSFTLTNLFHFLASPNTFGAGSSVTNQYGFFAASSISNNTSVSVGFYGDIASGTNRWNLFMNGTANNYLAGNLWIGTTLGTNTLDVNGTARIRTISNLGTAATSVLVPSATGVISLRTLAELSADMGNTWTSVGSGNIFRNSRISVGHTADPTESIDLGASGWIRTGQGASNAGGIILPFTSSNANSRSWTFRNDAGAFGEIGLTVSATQTGDPKTGNLIFRLTNVGNTGINGAPDSFSDYRYFSLYGASTTLGGVFIAKTSNSSHTFQLRVDSTANHLQAINNPMIFYCGTGGTERMRITNNGNLLIGTTTDAGSRLYVAGETRFQGNIVVLDNVTSDFSFGTTTGSKIGTATNQKIGFYNANPIVQPSGDILTALSNLGLVASPTITQVDQFSVKTTATADQTLPSGTLTILDYDTTLLNNSTATYTVGTTGRITINTTGIYTITAGVVIEADAVTALESAFLGIFRNGDLVAISSINTTIAAGTQSGLSTSTILSLTATDIIDCRALVNSVGGVANGLARRLGTLLGANATQVNSLSITKNSM